MGNKARLIRDTLELGTYEPELMRAEFLDSHPLTWILDVDGLPVDVRHAPFHVQQQALDLGLIPYLPKQPPTTSHELARLAEAITIDSYRAICSWILRSESSTDGPSRSTLPLPSGEVARHGLSHRNLESREVIEHSQRHRTGPAV